MVYDEKKSLLKGLKREASPKVESAQNTIWKNTVKKFNAKQDPRALRHEEWFKLS